MSDLSDGGDSPVYDYPDEPYVQKAASAYSWDPHAATDEDLTPRPHEPAVLAPPVIPDPTEEEEELRVIESENCAPTPAELPDDAFDVSSALHRRKRARTDLLTSEQSAAAQATIAEVAGAPSSPSSPHGEDQVRVKAEPAALVERSHQPCTAQVAPIAAQPAGGIGSAYTSPNKRKSAPDGDGRDSVASHEKRARVDARPSAPTPPPPPPPPPPVDLLPAFIPPPLELDDDLAPLSDDEASDVVFQPPPPVTEAVAGPRMIQVRPFDNRALDTDIPRVPSPPPSPSRRTRFDYHLETTSSTPASTHPSRLPLRRPRPRPAVPLARMCMEDLPPLPVAVDAAPDVASPVPQAFLLRQQSFWRTHRETIRRFRGHFTWSVRDALDLYPLAAVRGVTLTPPHVRVMPLVRTPNAAAVSDDRSLFGTAHTSPVVLFGRRFDDPLLQASEWCRLGFTHVMRMMETAEQTQMSLLRLYLHARTTAPTAATARSHPMPTSALASTKCAGTRLTPDQFRQLHPFAREYAHFLQQLYEIDVFFLYLNTFVLETFHAPTAESDPCPRFTPARRMHFLSVLHEEALDLFRLATSSSHGLTPPERLFEESARGGRSFARHIATTLMQFQLKTHSEVLWLYDNHMIKYNLLTLRRHAENFTRDDGMRSDDPFARWRSGSRRRSPTLDSIVYFPIFSYVEHLFQSLLTLTHRHPHLCALSSPRPSPSTANSPVWVWQPVVSMWLKVKETLLALDRSVLYSRDDDLPSHLEVMWSHHECDQRVVYDTPLAWLGTSPLDVASKLKQIESYRRSLRAKEADTRPLLFDTLMHLAQEQLLRVSLVAHWSEADFQEVALKDDEITWTPSQRTRVIRRVMDCIVHSPYMTDGDDALTSTARHVRQLISPSSAHEFGSSSLDRSSVLDRMESLFQLVLQVVRPHAYHFETFLTPHEGTPGRRHRFLDPTPRREIDPNAELDIGLSMHDDEPTAEQLDARPFVLLPFMHEAATVPPNIARYGLSIEAYFRLLQCQLDWSLFASLLQHLHRIDDWRSNAMRHQTVADLARVHGSVDVTPESVSHSQLSESQPDEPTFGAAFEASAPSGTSAAASTLHSKRRGAFFRVRSRLHYPVLFLTRLVSLQRTSLVCVTNLTEESKFLTDVVMRSKFMMDIEAAVRIRRRHERSGGGGVDATAAAGGRNQASSAAHEKDASHTIATFLLPHIFDADRLTPTGMGLERNDDSHTCARAAPPSKPAQKGVTFSATSVGGIGSSAPKRPVEAIEDFFHLTLRMMYQLLQRTIRPRMGHATLFSSSPSPACQPLLEFLHATGSATRDRSMVFFVDKMCKKLKAPLRDANIAFRKLAVVVPLGDVAAVGVPSIYFTGDLAHVDASQARANLLALQRRLSMLLVMVLLLPRTMPPSFKFTPVDVLTSLTANVTASRPADGARWTPIGTHPPKNAADTYAIAEHTLMRAYVAYMRIRQDYVDFESREFMELMHFRSGGPASGATPSSLSVGGAATWRHHWMAAATFKPSYDCGYDDVLFHLLRYFFASSWSDFLAAELRRKKPAQDAPRDPAHLALEEQNRRQDRIAEYLASVLRIVEAMLVRRREQRTVNELAIIAFDLREPQQGNNDTAGSTTTNTVSFLLHELLDVHGSNVRIPFALRAQALRILQLLLPGGEWSPTTPVAVASAPSHTPAPASARAPSPSISMMDDLDDAAFLEFDMDGVSEEQAQKRADDARVAAAAREAAEAAKFRQQLQEEQAARTHTRRQEYLRELYPFLLRCIPLLHQMLFSSLHDAGKVRKRIIEVNRHQTAAAAMIGVRPNAAAAAAGTFADSVSALRAAAAPATPTSAILFPLPHHLLGGERFLLQLVDTLASIAHVLVSANLLQWKFVSEHWFPLFAYETDVTKPKTQRAASGADEKKTLFTLADVESPLRETMVLRFYSALLTPSKFYCATPAAHAFADSPQVFLTLWLQRALDFDAKLMRPMMHFTNVILESRSLEWTGSNDYGRLADFFEPQEKVIAWLRREERQAGAAAHMRQAQTCFQWLDDKLKTISHVLRAYARKFSPIYRIGAGGAVAVPSSVQPGHAGLIASSSGLTSVFAKIATLMRHNVQTLNDLHTAQRGNISSELCALYLDYLYAFLGGVLEECSDCLNPRSAALSVSILTSFTDNFIRVQPTGIAHEYAYRASTACVTSAIIGYSAHLTTRATLTATELHAEVSRLFSTAFTLKGQIHKLWSEYMHIIHSDPSRFKMSDDAATGTGATPFRFTRYAADARQAPAQHVTLSLKERLFDSWRRGLLGARATDDDLLDDRDAAHRSRVLTPARAVRATQMQLMRRYVLALFATHALGQAVMVLDGDARIQWAHDILREIVTPIITRTELENLVDEFRSTLPALLALLFQCRDFLPQFHISSSSAPAARQQLTGIGNHAATPWLVSSGTIALRKSVMQLINTAVRRCLDVAPDAAVASPHAPNDATFINLFGVAPFMPTADEAAKYSGAMLIRLIGEHLVHDVGMMMAEGEARIPHAELSSSRAGLEFAARSLATRHFRPAAGVADSFHRLSKDLPRSPTMAQVPPPMPMPHLLYLDIIVQYFRFFQMLMRLTLQTTSDADTNRHTDNAKTNPAAPPVAINPWTRMALPVAAPVAHAAPSPSPQKPVSLWHLASEVEPHAHIGPANRAWIVSVLERLMPLLDPVTAAVSTNVRQSSSYRRVCAEYALLLAALEDDELALRFSFQGMERQQASV